jgi:hypothetical protein
MLWAPGSVWKVFQLVRANFEQFGAGPVTWGGLTATQAVSCVVGGLTVWGRRSNCPGQSEQFFLLFVALPCCIAALVQREYALAQGELAYVQGDLFVVFELWFGGLCSLFEHGFCLGCVEPLPLPKGSETCLLQVILLFAFLWLSIAC